eukprot:GHVU01066257.1.p2 GENE.GHVU01066257.1~~GHVU01066257.1.p2  ORF type:complete len:124 (+),score=19.95 GHVU01066257.1:223-594(+)
MRLHTCMCYSSSSSYSPPPPPLLLLLLQQGEIVVVRCTLIGSILSNLLLVTGCAFFFGGIKHKDQFFTAVGASTNASLMTLSCLCLGLPTMYATLLSAATYSELEISRSVSALLGIMYLQVRP